MCISDPHRNVRDDDMELTLGSWLTIRPASKLFSTFGRGELSPRFVTYNFFPYITYKPICRKFPLDCSNCSIVSIVSYLPTSIPSHFLLPHRSGCACEVRGVSCTPKGSPNGFWCFRRLRIVINWHWSNVYQLSCIARDCSGVQQVSDQPSHHPFVWHLCLQLCVSLIHININDDIHRLDYHPWHEVYWKKPCDPGRALSCRSGSPGTSAPGPGDSTCDTFAIAGGKVDANGWK